MGEARRRLFGGGNQPRPQQVQMKVQLDQLKDRVCECGGAVFFQAFMLKEIPPVCSPSGQYETAMNHIGFTCIACGKLMTLRPEPLKEDEKEESKIIVVGN